MNQQHVSTPSESESLSHTIVCAVAEAKGVDPMELNERLFDCIDPDALDRLFDTEAYDVVGSVMFSMAGCRVRVESGRTIVVTETDGSRTEVHA